MNLRIGKYSGVKWGLLISCNIAGIFMMAALAGAMENNLDAPSRKARVVSDVGFAQPESIKYYAREDVYLVSNVNGGGLEKNGAGFISKVSPDGEIVDLKWIDGRNDRVTLHAPKGLAIQNGLLYVADIGVLQVFDIETGDQVSSIPLEGSSLLNGVAASGDEYVLVANTGSKAQPSGSSPASQDMIYRVWPSGRYETVFSEGYIGGVNGIFFRGETIYVVTFGSGELIEIHDNRKSTVVKFSAAGLDGVVMLSDGRAVVSGWSEGTIYKIDAGGEVTVLAAGVGEPADIGFDPSRNRILVPLFGSNSLMFLPLE